MPPATLRAGGHAFTVTLYLAWVSGMFDIFGLKVFLYTLILCLSGVSVATGKT